MEAQIFGIVAKLVDKETLEKTRQGSPNFRFF